MVDDAKPLAKGRGQQADACRRSDQGESWQLQADGPGARSASDDQVEGEVLHRGVEDLLEGPAEAVDFVDEQHVAELKIRHDGGEVPGLSIDGLSDANLPTHLAGNDVGASVVFPRPGGP